MIKQRQKSGEAGDNVMELLCEHYLPAVFQYVNYWVNNTELAEELTLSALKKALVRLKDGYKEEKTFALGVFTTARKEIQSHSRISSLKPILPNLSHQEQEVISLKFGAALDNRRISKILSLPESSVGRIIYESLCKLNGCLEVPK